MTIHRDLLLLLYLHQKLDENNTRVVINKYILLYNSIIYSIVHVVMWHQTLYFL